LLEEKAAKILKMPDLLDQRDNKKTEGQQMQLRLSQLHERHSTLQRSKQDQETFSKAAGLKGCTA
jgi:hypothetical protein